MYMENEGGREKTWCGERLVAAWTGKVRGFRAPPGHCAALGLSLQRRGMVLEVFPGFILKVRQENIHFVQKRQRGNFLLWLRWPLGLWALCPPAVI